MKKIPKARESLFHFFIEFLYKTVSNFSQYFAITVTVRPMDTILYIIAGSLFLISFAGYLYVKLSLKPKEDSDLDDYYHEFEDQHPGLAKYTRWSKITFTVAVIAALLLFLALVF
jgi:uncharacterized membrane protein YqhA